MSFGSLHGQPVAIKMVSQDNFYMTRARQGVRWQTRSGYLNTFRKLMDTHQVMYFIVLRDPICVHIKYYNLRICILITNKIVLPELLALEETEREITIV